MSIEEQEAIAAFLAEDDFATIDEWADASDYYRNDACEDGIWINEFGDEVEIHGAILGAMQESGFTDRWLASKGID